jgi:2-dehydropantoate 2-reductase
MAHDKRIHILGTGSIGVFVAHALLDIPKRPSVTLLLHRESLLEDFRRAATQLTLEELNGSRFQQQGYDIEVKRDDGWHLVAAHGSPHEIEPTATTTGISNLILTVKTIQTVNALRPLKNRLSRDSNILFLQNGSGQIEDVNEQLFPDPATRPNYLIGVISHGVITLSPFNVRHTGPSATSIGPVPRTERNITNQTTDDATTKAPSSYLLDVLPRAPRLAAKSYSFEEIVQYQIEKLVVNAFNAVGSLANQTNRYYFTIPDRFAALIREVSAVALSLKELKNIPGAHERFSHERLRSMAEDILRKNMETTNSMIWDLRKGIKTEVDYLNGFWVRRGKEAGIPTPINEALVHGVKQRERENDEKR